MADRKQLLHVDHSSDQAEQKIAAHVRQAWGGAMWAPALAGQESRSYHSRYTNAGAPTMATSSDGTGVRQSLVIPQLAHDQTW